MKVQLIAVLSFAMIQGARAQQNAETRMVLPDIPGYRTLKCDFHLHTIFSDGHVWPSFRVKEALRDGLDVISLTEHIDYEGYPDEIKKDYNRSFQIASESAKGKDLLLIQGAEISPRVPPYHHNVLFLKDVNTLPIDYMKNTKKTFVMKDKISREQLLAPFLEAQKQDAFVLYNHPGYAWWDRRDTAIFTTIHQDLLDRGILKGVEVVNSGRYNIIGHQIAMKYDLTMFCNSDEHYDAFASYSKSHRPVTLVFAKEKTEASVKEALIQKRTALYFDDYIIARQALAEEFFKASLNISTLRSVRKAEHILIVKIFNKSEIPYRVRLSADYDIDHLPLGQVTLKPRDTTTITLKAMWKYPEKTPLRFRVDNILVNPDEPLNMEYQLTTDEQDLKVMTYNIHHGYNKDEVEKLEEMGTFIKSSGADLVGLQEVDSMCNRSGNKDQMKRLAQITGMHYAFVRHFPYDGGAYGLGILSRYPISEIRNERIPSLGKHGSLALMSAKVSLPGDKKLAFATAHFALDQPTRLKQAEETVRLLKQDIPVILTGDLNAEPGTPEIIKLSDYFSATGRYDLLSFPERKPIKRIDYIFVSSTGLKEVRDIRTFNDIYHSDHLPLISTVQLR